MKDGYSQILTFIKSRLERRRSANQSINFRPLSPIENAARAEPKCKVSEERETPRVTRNCHTATPESILVVDRPLIRAWITVRRMFPEIGPEHLAFRTLSEKNAMQYKTIEKVLGK